VALRPNLLPWPFIFTPICTNLHQSAEGVMRGEVTPHGIPTPLRNHRKQQSPVGSSSLAGFEVTP
jgi:hypothetical protein